MAKKLRVHSLFEWSLVQNQDPSKWNRCSHRVAKVANDRSTLNNEAKAQTLNGPSVLYDQQHF